MECVRACVSVCACACYGMADTFGFWNESCEQSGRAMIYTSIIENVELPRHFAWSSNANTRRMWPTACAGQSGCETGRRARRRPMRRRSSRAPRLVRASNNCWRRRVPRSTTPASSRFWMDTLPLLRLPLPRPPLPRPLAPQHQSLSPHLPRLPLLPHRSRLPSHRLRPSRPRRNRPAPRTAATATMMGGSSADGSQQRTGKKKR